MVSQDTISLRSNGDILDMLVSWMQDNNTTNWTTGMKKLVSEKPAR